MMLLRPRARSTMKTGSKNNFCPHSYFTEHLVCVFRKLPQKNNLDHESSRLSIRWLNSTPGIQPATIQPQHEREKQITPGAENNPNLGDLERPSTAAASHLPQELKNKTGSKPSQQILHGGRNYILGATAQQITGAPISRN
jgi:hypothetical protein